MLINEFIIKEAKNANKYFSIDYHKRTRKSIFGLVESYRKNPTLNTLQKLIFEIFIWGNYTRTAGRFRDLETDCKLKCHLLKSITQDKFETFNKLDFNDVEPVFKTFKVQLKIHGVDTSFFTKIIYFCAPKEQREVKGFLILDKILDDNAKKLAEEVSDKLYLCAPTTITARKYEMYCSFMVRMSAKYSKVCGTKLLPDELEAIMFKYNHQEGKANCRLHLR